MNYQTLHKNRKQFQSVSGFSHQDFVALHKEFAPVWAEMRSEATMDGRSRKRKPSQRIDAVLQTTQDVLLFVLSYLKNYPTQEYHASVWGMYQGQAHRCLKQGLAAVQRTLMKGNMLPARTALDLAERLEGLPAGRVRKKFTLDATERPIERPKNKVKQQQTYSGKKKKHTIKYLMLNDEQKRLHFLSKAFVGSFHDKRCADESALVMPEGSELFQDTGFQGLSLAKVVTRQPMKKPKGKELSAEQKQKNQAISRERISIEHSIGGTKVFRVAKEILRIKSARLCDIVMEVCVGLFNFKNHRRKNPY